MPCESDPAHQNAWGLARPYLWVASSSSAASAIASGNSAVILCAVTQLDITSRPYESAQKLGCRHLNRRRYAALTAAVIHPLIANEPLLVPFVGNNSLTRLELPSPWRPSLPNRVWHSQWWSSWPPSRSCWPWHP